MARSAFEIQMDYRNAIRQADSLSEIARELKNTANSGLQPVRNYPSCCLSC